MMVQAKHYRQTYRLIVENTSDLITTTDIDGKFTYVSPSHEYILGYKKEELLGVNAFSLIHPDDRKRVFTEFKRGLQGHQTAIESFRVRHKDGTWRYLETSEAIVLNNDHTPYLFVANMRDITTRVENEQRKDAFISILTHELRTPLTSILLMTSLMEKRLSVTQEIQFYFLKLKEQIDTISQLTQLLVDVSDMEQGLLHLKKEEVLLTEYIKEVVSYQVKNNEHKVIIKDGDNEKVRADKKRLGEVVNVLLSNAIKYSGADEPITINVAKKARKVEVSVTDYGLGIPQSEQDNIFQKYYQFGDQTQYLRPGFGIGLYFARELMKMHKGDLWVTSEYGKGSTFYFSLPLK